MDFCQTFTTPLLASSLVQMTGASQLTGKSRSSLPFPPPDRQTWARRPPRRPDLEEVSTTVPRANVPDSDLELQPSLVVGSYLLTVIVDRSPRLPVQAERRLAFIVRSAPISFNITWAEPSASRGRGSLTTLGA
ncbi:hypothetical protein M6B38_229650 [Iris pallida]|uniref:Uncharacterized protein n=1 Tax=Iris pallida TaxID=29817 RepID=A0AAX6DS15_IRIPA|nr:hypothetical protein M6B38_229650 [Iris pallida]